MRGYKDMVLPDDAIMIPVRADWTVIVCNMPHDLTRSEANKIIRVLEAYSDVPNDEEI